MKLIKRPCVLDAKQFFPDKFPWPSGVYYHRQINQQPHFYLHGPNTNPDLRIRPGDWIGEDEAGNRYRLSIQQLSEYTPLEGLEERYR